MYAEEPDVFDSLTDQNATHDAMNRMELFGAMPPADEVDPRPLPDQNTSFASLEGVFDTLAELFTDTCLESEATDVLWNMNRPGFTGGCFVQMSGYFIKHIQVCIECLLSFARRCVTNGAV